MSEENKFFDKEKRQQAIKWLEEKWPEHKRECDICGQKQWNIPSFLVFPHPYNQPVQLFSGGIAPQVMVICKNCGNTKYLNAVIMGILPVGDENE